MFEKFGISERLCALDEELMAACAPAFLRAEQIRDYNQIKVLEAFTRNRVGAQHFAGSTGYGYGDVGRDALDRDFADAFGAEDALCRAQFMSGTHALTVALFGILRAGDTLLAATGEPYDTLQSVISGDGVGSLREFGVRYEQVELLNGQPDYKEIERRAPGAKLVHIQRSRGYSGRDAFSCDVIEKTVAAAKRGNPNAVVMVDNCYGEFTETTEPTQHGADLIVGSLIKNAGGAVAETGGYIAGRADCVELCAHRLTAPGTGREIGCWPQGLRTLYLGLYMAPAITCEAVKSGIYAAALFQKLGFPTFPDKDAPRSDIVTTVELGSPDNLKKVCAAIQGASPVDSYAVPEPWAMPGYTDEVIMAAGAFTNGSSIELSCDGPLRAPYRLYLQGGISLTASRYAYLKAAALLTE
ncbi:MAG: methionine gamma-lyase family protein [Oscillospiraceae bacterium]|nr:methionine gamma-lyase family protein [Oscillospiraceae bacterium]